MYRPCFRFCNGNSRFSTYILFLIGTLLFYLRKWIETEKIPLESYQEMLGFDKKRILITAESGYGKSTLFKKIAHDWAVLQKTKSKLPANQQRGRFSCWDLFFIMGLFKDVSPVFSLF